MKKYLTYNNFLERIIKLNDPYWTNTYKTRWTYMDSVIKEATKLAPESILEIGVNGISICNFSHTLELTKAQVMNKNNTMYIFNAKDIDNWKQIPDKSYDCVVAQQVLEHLQPNVKEVFNEIKRISKSAIITLPYLWENTDNLHYMVTLEKIKKWTNMDYTYIKEFNEVPNRRRVLLIYKFG